MPAQGRKYLSISETAKFLGVSIDTIRRWDKNHTLNSIRLDGKNRYFDFEELTKLKSNKPLSISEAATRLGVSITTLRRLEVRGLLTPSRDANGERLYTKESLDHYLDNRNFSRKEAQRDDLQDSSSIQSVSGMTDASLNSSEKRSHLHGGETSNQQAHEKSNNFVKNVSENSEYSANQTQNAIPSELPTQSDSSELSESSELSDSDKSHSVHAAQYFTAPIMSFFKSEDLFFRAPRLHRPSFEIRIPIIKTINFIVVFKIIPTNKGLFCIGQTIMFLRHIHFLKQ
jgi:excisionase family DNA binding protein